MEKIKAEFLLSVCKVEDMQKHNEMVGECNEKRSQELECKENELLGLRLDFDERVKQFEAEKVDFKKLVEASYEKRSQELEFKEKELQSLSSDFEKRCEIFKKEKAEADSLRIMVEGSVEKRSQELKLQEEKLQSLSLDLDRKTTFFKKHKAEAGNLKRMVDECTEELRSKRKQLIATLESLANSQRELGTKDHQLVQVVAQLRKRRWETQEVEDRKKEIEGEMHRKKKELELVLDQIEGEICRKKEELGLILSQVEGKKRELGLVLDQIEGDICRKKEELGLILSQVEGKERELGLVNDQIKVSDKQYVALDEQIESRQRQLKMQSSELAYKMKELECVTESIKLSKSDIELKEKKVESLNNFISGCAQEIDKKSEELGKIQKMIEQQTGELGVLNEKLETKEERYREIVECICRSSSEMEEKAKEIEVAGAEASGLCAKSQRFRKEVDDKEKELCLLKNQVESEKMELIQLKREMEEESGRKKEDMEMILSKIQESGKQLELKYKELGEVEKLIEDKRKRLCDMQNQQPYEPVYEAAPLHHESSACLVRDEVSSDLRTSHNPAELVLYHVCEYITEGSGLEDSSIEVLILYFDELAKIQRRIEPQLQLKARQVATLWKGKITIEAPKSSLEALAFALFIVAYGLKELINQEETVMLASSIAHYRQAPKLFHSLGLTLTISEFVEELIKNRHYIPAVRFMCLFQLNIESSLSPSELLKEEITNLRQSALGKSPTQAKDKDAGRLRAILELVADYNLEVDLPGDLVAKLIIQREKSTPLVRCSVIELPSSPNQQASNSPKPVSAQRSMNLLTPKPEVKPLKRTRF